MSSTKTLRSRKGRRASRSSLGLESLEPRLALTVPVSNVNARLVGSTLLLTGDALDNALVVATATGGRMAVLGTSPATTINGSTSPFVTSRAVSNIVANLNAGNDAIGFTNSAQGLLDQIIAAGAGSLFFDVGALRTAIETATGNTPSFSLPGSLSVTSGAGDDVVGIIGTVAGSVAANLGSATSTNGNSFAIGNLFGPVVLANRVGGSVSVVGGNQNDNVTIHGADVAGGVSLTLGNGDNSVYVRGITGTIGSFAYTGGTGNDVVALVDRITVRNGMSVFTGPRGEDDFDMVLAASVGGSVVVNTGAGADYDDITINASIRQDLSVITGAGDDEILLGDSTIGGAAAINSGAGADEIVVSNCTAGLNTVIDAGAGDDEVVGVGLTTRYNLFVYLGPGNDMLELNDARAFAAFLYGGTGTNTLTIDPTTRTNVRTLKYFQFQTVNV